MQKIFFGSVIIQHTNTGEKQTIENKIYKEFDKPTDEHLRNYVLKHIPTKERAKYKIIKLCTDTAKHTGDTVY